MKKLQTTVTRGVAFALSAVMAFSMAGCGKREAVNTVTETKEYVYVPEYIELEKEEEAYANFYNAQFLNNTLYYFSTSYVEGQTQTKLCSYSLESKEQLEIPITLGEQRNINAFALNQQGEMYTCENEWIMSDTDSSEKILLCKYDAQGNQIIEQDITDIIQKDEENSYINSMTIDSMGRIYLSSETKIRLFDTECSMQGEVSIGSGWIQGMGQGKDGNVYATYYDYNSTEGRTVLAPVNFDGKALGEGLHNFPNGNGNGALITGLEKDFLVNDGSKVYEYDINTQTTEELLTWLDSDINGTYVNYIAASGEGKLLAVISDWGTGEDEVAVLSKTKSSELPAKKQVVIGTMYNSQSLQAAAVDFNKNSDTYHISIKNYIDNNNWTENSWNDAITKLNNDITSGSNCPDVLDLSQINVKQLTAKGVFEDLTPYLEKSSVLNKEDFLESVLECYTYEGKLIGIPNSFSLSTIVGKSSDLGEEMGWTLDEMMAYSAEHPNATLFDGASKATMMYYMLNNNMDAFVNWETGECKFETDEFKKVLEFVNAFPDEIDWEADTRSTPVKIQEGEVLLNMAGIYELNSIQEYDAMFNEPVTFIGYPTVDGSAGCYIQANELYGIATKSQNKEGAWAFMESFLTRESDMYTWGLPTQKQKLETKIEEATKVEYMTDENGEQILDEEGNPIPINGGSSIGYGDWEYTYHVVTEEEVARIRELIDVAKPASGVNEELTKIITEEAEPFFQGQKSVDDVAGIIQSRIQIYVNENR